LLQINHTRGNNQNSNIPGKFRVNSGHKYY